MTRVSPPELAREWPAPHASTSVTLVPLRSRCNAVPASERSRADDDHVTLRSRGTSQGRPDYTSDRRHESGFQKPAARCVVD